MVKVESLALATENNEENSEEAKHGCQKTNGCVVEKSRSLLLVSELNHHAHHHFVRAGVMAVFAGTKRLGLGDSYNSFNNYLKLCQESISFNKYLKLCKHFKLVSQT